MSSSSPSIWESLTDSLWSIINEYDDFSKENVWAISKELVRITPELRTGLVKFSRYVAKGINIDFEKNVDEIIVKKFNSHLGESLNTVNTIQMLAEKMTKQLFLFGTLIVQKVYAKNGEKNGKIVDFLVRDAPAYRIKRDSSGKIISLSGIGVDNVFKELNLENYIIVSIDDSFDGDDFPTTSIASIIDLVALYRDIIDSYAKYLSRFATPHIHVALPIDTSEKIYQETKKEVENFEAESSFITLDGKIDILSTDMNSASVVQILNHLQDRITSGLMLPAWMLGISEGSNRSMGKEQRRDMKNLMSPYRNAIRLVLSEIYSEVLNREKEKLDMTIVFDDLDIDDRKTQSDSFALIMQSLSIANSLGFKAEFEKPPTMFMPDGSKFVLVEYEGNTETKGEEVNIEKRVETQSGKDKSLVKGVDNRAKS